MLDVAAWPSSTKYSLESVLLRVVFYTFFGVTILGFVASSEPTSLKTISTWLSYGQVLNTRLGKSAEATSYLKHGTSDLLREHSLGWRIQNQTQMNGHSRWELDDNGWHPRRIDVSEFLEIESIQPGRLELVKHPDFGNTPVLLKIADAHEAMIYRLLYDLAITPLFLAHITQDDKMVGFVTEFIEREEATPTPSPPSRRETCLAALRRMHTRGVAHQDAHGENCLLRSDGSAALIDFELSTETSSRADFDRDLWIMYHTVVD